eukprot:1155487-Pelagomonas_calceolata.AAC.2
MALEDATGKAFNLDIYAPIVNFTSAFNTTDHDKLLIIMYDLGFPTDAIDVVKKLYHQACTRVKLPSGGYTSEIPVEAQFKGTHFLPSSSSSTLNPCSAGCTLVAEATHMPAPLPHTHPKIKLKIQLAVEPLLTISSALLGTPYDLWKQNQSYLHPAQQRAHSYAGTQMYQTLLSTYSLEELWCKANLLNS